MITNNDIREISDVLSRSWETQQKKAFTEWCNSYLKKKNVKIKSFSEDFSDGHNLIKLLEVIANQSLPKPETKNMRFHKIANVNIGLDFIKSKGVKLVSIAAEEIVDGNIKLTLGMIWTIILRFTIQNIKIEERSSKEGLLLWCQRNTANYDGVNIKNFHTSFNDGMAFGALIHKHRPDLIDIKKYNIMTPKFNLENAFEVAQHYLDIPQMLDIEDMIKSEQVDQHAVMAYVSTFYHRFTFDRKVTKAKETINLWIQGHKEIGEMISDYNHNSSLLIEWIQQTSKWLSNRTESQSLELSERILERYQNYKFTQKSPQYCEKIKLEKLYNNIQTQLRMSEKPNFVPKENISEINRIWKKLDFMEKDFEEWIFELIERSRIFTHLVNKFMSRCGAYDIWLKDKFLIIPNIDFKSIRLEEIDPMMKKISIIKQILTRDVSERDLMTEITEMVDYLRENDYYDWQILKNKEEELKDKHESLYKKCIQLIAQLDEVKVSLMKADNLSMEYAVKATEFKTWLDSVNEDMEDGYIITGIVEASDLLLSHQKFEHNLVAAESRLEEIKSLVEEIYLCYNKMGLSSLTETIYTTISIESLLAAWNKMSRLNLIRSKQLDDEVENQENIQLVKDKFKNSLMAVEEWIMTMIDEIEQFQLTNFDNFDLDYLFDFEERVHEFDPHLKSLEKNQRAIETQPLDRNNLDFSVQKVQIDYEKLKSIISSKIMEIKKMHKNSSGGLQHDTITDYKACFAHFDKDDNHRLDPEEFKNFLVSIGYDSAVIENESAFLELMNRVDKGKTGFITFNEFLDFAEEINQSTLNNLIGSFAVLADGKPYITEKTLEENLPGEQADYCRMNMEKVQADELDSFDYVAFAHYLFGKIKEN